MRSQDRSSIYFDLEQQCYSTDGLSRATTQRCSLMSTVRRGFRMNSLKGSPNFYRTNKIDGRKKVKAFDYQSPSHQRWNKIFAVSCIIAVSLDPLFFYIPVTDNNRKCLDLDNKLKVIACTLRSLMDLFYTFHILLQVCTRHVTPSSSVAERALHIKDSRASAKRYLSTWFIVDILAVLPLPQVVILNLAPTSLITKNLLEISILSQYLPRLLRIYPLYKAGTRISGIFPETPWTGAAFNLFLYMLASNLLGAYWYLFAVEHVDACWRESCAKHDCDFDALYCGIPRFGDYSFLNSSCLLLDPNEIKQPTDYNFGIVLDALQSDVVEKQKFWKKFFYCFWWGLQNLSSLGQNLKTSNSVGENLFAISISITGLVLFALLIGNMQKYLQSISEKIEEMRTRRRGRKSIEHWMSHRVLPENIRRRIRNYEQYKWKETKGVEEDALIKNLPKDLRRDINRLHRRALLRRVPLFVEMDQWFQDALCDLLYPVLYTKKSYIYNVGDLIDEMLFLTRGRLLSTTTNGGTNDSYSHLGPGDWFGEELVPWALFPPSRSGFPISTRTVQAMEDVEAFALRASDLKSLASQFPQNYYIEKFRARFRYCSQQWRVWAAFYIQAAWRRHCRTKLQKSLQEDENKLQGSSS